MGTKATVQIWHDDTGWEVVADEEGQLWGFNSEYPMLKLSAEELHWSDHEYKSFAGALRALGQVA